MVQSVEKDTLCRGLTTEAPVTLMTAARDRHTGAEQCLDLLMVKSDDLEYTGTLVKTMTESGHR